MSDYSVRNVVGRYDIADVIDTLKDSMSSVYCRVIVILQSQGTLQLGVSLFNYICDTSTQNDLSCGQVLGLKGDLRRSFRALTHFPDAGLKLISWFNRCGEAHSKEFQRIWIIFADGFEDRTTSKTECRQPVKNDASKAGTFTNLGVCL